MIVIPENLQEGEMTANVKQEQKKERTRWSNGRFREVSEAESTAEAELELPSSISSNTQRRNCLVLKETQAMLREMKKVHFKWSC